jgi:MoaA/NifB/PqqE/SkfB family radical SAM enzyme
MEFKRLKLIKKIINSNFHELSLPYKLTFVATDRCNHKCKICNIWSSAKKEESKIEDIEAFFKKADYFSWISLTGGEIFLRQDIYDICVIISKNVKDACFLTFPTNGFLTEDIISNVKKIVELNFSKIVVSISLDGPPRLNDELRGVSGAWDRAVRTFVELKKIKNRKLSVNFGHTVSGYNIDSMKETMESVKKVYPELSLKDFHVNLAFNAERYVNTGSDKIEIKDEKRIMDQLNLYKNKKIFLLDPISMIDCLHVKLLNKYIRSKKTPLPCLSLGASCLVDVDWNVYPCFNFNEKAGNLKEFDFDLKKIWAAYPRKNLRDSIKKGHCPSCWTPCESFQTILGNLPKAVFEK